MRDITPRTDFVLNAETGVIGARFDMASRPVAQHLIDAIRLTGAAVVFDEPLEQNLQEKP